MSSFLNYLYVQNSSFQKYYNIGNVQAWTKQMGHIRVWSTFSKASHMYSYAVYKKTSGKLLFKIFALNMT